MSKLPTWCEWATTDREADLQFYDFDDLTLTHESSLFPSHVSDPFKVEIIPPFFDEETRRVTQQKILHRAFEDILDNTDFRSMVFEYTKPELSWTSQDRDAVLGGGGTPKNKVDFFVTADYMRPQDGQDDANPGTGADANQKFITMKLVLSRNCISKYEMIDALMNQSLIARLSGMPHLALLTDDSTRDNFAFQEYVQEVSRSPGSVKIRFPQDHLRDPTTGEYKFCDLIPAVFTRSIITPLNGSDASTTLPIHYSVPKMCNCGRCFHRGGIASHSTRNCPLEGACKWCWKFPDESKSIGHHIMKVTPYQIPPKVWRQKVFLTQICTSCI